MREKRSTAKPTSQQPQKRARIPSYGSSSESSEDAKSSDSGSGNLSLPARRPSTAAKARNVKSKIGSTSTSASRLVKKSVPHKTGHARARALPAGPPQLRPAPSQLHGWGRLLDFNYPIYMELVQEFYATFSCKIADDVTGDTPVVKFRLLGKPFHMSFIQLNVALGMIDSVRDASVLVEAIGGYTSEFKMDRQRFWRKLINDTTVSHIANKSKAFNIVDPALRIIHTWLGHSLSARPRGTNVVTKMELCLLWCMKNNHKADFARWLVKQFESVVKCLDMTNKRGLSLGVYITRIAVHEGLLDIHDTSMFEVHRVEDMIMDTDFYLRTHIVRRKGEDLEFTPPGTSVSGPVVSQGVAVEDTRFMVNVDRQEENDRLDDLYTRLEALEKGQERIIELLEKGALHSPTSDSAPLPSTG